VTARLAIMVGAIIVVWGFAIYGAVKFFGG